MIYFSYAKKQYDRAKRLAAKKSISIEKKEVEAIIPAEFAAKAYAFIKSQSNSEKEDWLNDGSLLIVLKVPVGVATELVDNLSSMTHGNIDIKIK